MGLDRNGNFDGDGRMQVIVVNSMILAGVSWESF